MVWDSMPLKGVVKVDKKGLPSLKKWLLLYFHSSNSYYIPIHFQMSLYKRQSIQKLIVEQGGSERLILNDLIIGRDGA